MDINIRRIGNGMTEVIISHSGTTINIGLLNKAERLELSERFEEAIDTLMSGPEMAEE